MFKSLSFMNSLCHGEIKYGGQPIVVSRLGYTGEDGFEVAVPNAVIHQFMENLLKLRKIDSDEALNEMVGLGARDSLRLEAGLCLYGHDISEETSPIDAALAWTISKRRKEQGGFLGFERVAKEIADGVVRKRCGFMAEGKLPVREGAELSIEGKVVGIVTSGGPAPSLNNAGVGMAYVDTSFNKLKTKLTATVRGKEIPITVKKMPFVANTYYKP